MLLSLELKLLLLHFSRHKQRPQLDSPAGVPVGIRPYPLPATVHALPRGFERKREGVWNRTQMSPRVWAWLPQPWQGVEGHWSNLWTAWGRADSPAPPQFQHLNILICYEAWSKEEEAVNGDKQWGSQSYSTHLPRVYVPCGLTSLPPLSLLLCPCSCRWQGLERGVGGKVIPIWYSRISVVRDGGVGGHVSLHISDKTTLQVMTFYPPGITCFLCLREMRGRALLLYFHIKMQFISSSNGVKKTW